MVGITRSKVIFFAWKLLPDEWIVSSSPRNIKIPSLFKNSSCWVLDFYWLFNHHHRTIFFNGAPQHPRGCHNYFVHPQVVPKLWGKDSPPRQKIKVGTDPNVPRVRDTDDALDGNLVEPVIWLHNHLLILAYVGWTNRILILKLADLFPGIYMFKKFQAQTGSECVFSDPDPAFTLVLLCLHTWRVPLKTRQPNLLWTWQVVTSPKPKAKIRMEKLYCYHTFDGMRLCYECGPPQYQSTNLISSCPPPQNEHNKMPQNHTNKNLQSNMSWNFLLWARKNQTQPTQPRSHSSQPSWTKAKFYI